MVYKIQYYTMPYRDPASYYSARCRNRTLHLCLTSLVHNQEATTYPYFFPVKNTLSSVCS